jgi:hypothetical protein
MASLVQLEDGDILVFSNTDIADSGNQQEVAAWFRRHGITAVVFDGEVDVSVVRKLVAEASDAVEGA